MKVYKERDLTAPRFRKHSTNALGESFIRLLKKKFPEFESFSKQEIDKIIITFNKNLYLSVIDNRDGVELPENLGHMFIGSCEKNNMPMPDFKRFIETKQLCELNNFESDMHLAKIFYTTFSTKYRFRNNELWGFTACRLFKNAVSSTYPKQWKKYIEVDKKTPIHKISSGISVRAKEGKVEKSLEFYNEFDI